MALIPSDVTAGGNLELHNRGAHQFTFSFTDNAGAARNVSALNFWFETELGHRLLLTNGVATNQKVLKIAQYKLQDLIDLPVEAVIVDETLGAHVTEWQGTVSVTGWSDYNPPTMTMDFTAKEVLDPRIMIIGGVNGTRVNAAGVIVASSAPRFDYDPITLAPRGLLIEEGRTNLIMASHTGVGWTSNGGNTVTVNALLAPDGTTSATKIEVASGTTNLRNKSCTITANSTVTASIFLKAGSGGIYQAVIAYGISGSYTAWLNTATGAITGGTLGGSYSAGSMQAVAYKNGWWRVTLTVTTATDTALTLETDQATASGNYNSSVGHHFFTWGGQVETGVFATSYIPTTSAAVTRTEDDLVITGANLTSWFNPGQGTFVVFMDRTASWGYNPALGFENSARSFGMFFDNTATAGVIYIGDAATLNTVDRSSPNTIAAGYSATNPARISLEGGAVATGTNIFAYTATSIQLGRAGSWFLNGHLKTLKYFKTLKSDSEIKAFTA